MTPRPLRSRKTPPLLSLSALLKEAEAYASAAMHNAGQVPPTLLAATPEGTLLFQPESMADGAGKESFANAVRLVCAGYSATAPVMVLESWVSFPEAGEPLDTPPSEDFNRKEFVVLMGEARGGMQEQRMLPIIRTDLGGFFGFGEFDASEFSGFQGRFAQLLPPREPDEAMRQMAKAVLAATGVTREALRRQPGRK